MDDKRKREQHQGADHRRALKLIVNSPYSQGEPTPADPLRGLVHIVTIGQALRVLSAAVLAATVVGIIAGYLLCWLAR